jgi:hypothetical protein
MFRVQDFNATDLRDEIYAVRGLVGDVTDPSRALALYRNYDKSVLNVYLDTVQYFLEYPNNGHNGKLGFLATGHITEESFMSMERMNPR